MTIQAATTTYSQIAPLIQATSLARLFSDNDVTFVYSDGNDMAAEGHEGLERYAFIRGDVVMSVAIVLRDWRSGIRSDRPVLSVARSENGGRTYVEVGRDLTERQAAHIVLRHLDTLRNGDE